MTEMITSRRFLGWAAFCTVLCGCVAVGLKTMARVETQRAQKVQRLGADIVQTATTLRASLPDAPPEVVSAIDTIADTAQEVQHNANVSEKWHTAGQEALGPPPEKIDANTDEEKISLAQFEKDAETAGKVRGVVNGIRTGAAQIGTSGGGIGGWIAGGGLAAMLTGLGGVAELGRRRMNRMDEAREASLRQERESRQREQEERDASQDQKLAGFMSMVQSELATMADRIVELSQGRDKPPA